MSDSFRFGSSARLHGNGSAGWRVGLCGVAEDLGTCIMHNSGRIGRAKFTVFGWWKVSVLKTKGFRANCSQNTRGLGLLLEWRWIRLLLATGFRFGLRSHGVGRLLR